MKLGKWKVERHNNTDIILDDNGKLVCLPNMAGTDYGPLISLVPELVEAVLIVDAMFLTPIYPLRDVAAKIRQALNEL